LGIAGDAARGLGAWWGMARSRSIAPLLPRVRRPGAAVAETARAPGPERVEDDSRILVSPG
ncbi:family 2 glycosyl transferase, partial [Nocardiopsis sp. frass1]